MAKFGEKGGGYDPFSQISSSLSALQERPVEEEPAAPPKAAEPAPEPPQNARPVATPPAPTREPRPQRRNRTPASSGGVVAEAKPAPVQTPVSPEVALRVTKRFKTTRDEALRLDQAALKLGAHLGTSVDMSKITRALWDVYLRHEEEILRSLPADQPSRRPANNDAVGLAELDERLADMIGEGLMMACMRQRRS